jgi:hypothetical protein
MTETKTRDTREELQELLEQYRESQEQGGELYDQIRALIGGMNNADDLMLAWKWLPSDSDLRDMVIETFQDTLKEKYGRDRMIRLVHLRNRAPRGTALEDTITDYIITLLIDNNDLAIVLRVYDNLADDPGRQGQVANSLEVILGTYDQDTICDLVDVWATLKDDSPSQQLVGARIMVILKDIDDWDKIREVWLHTQTIPRWRKIIQSHIKDMIDHVGKVADHPIPQGFLKIVRNRRFILREAGDFLGGAFVDKFREVRDKLE